MKYRSFVGADALRFQLAQRVREILLFSDLFNYNGIGDVVGLLIQLSEAEVGVLLVIYHQLGLNLKDLDTSSQIVLPLLLDFREEAIDKWKNFEFIYFLFHFLSLFKLPLVFALQLFTFAA
jgi:hypothetical protein